MKKRAFSLVEVLIAMALAGLIMVASSALLLSITQIWITEDNTDNFQDHVKGVQSFLIKNIKSCYYKPKSWMEFVGFRIPPTASFIDKEERFYFTILAPHPLLPGVTSGPVSCFLSIEKSVGLCLDYHNYFEQEDSSQVPIYRRIISPYATDMLFHYYDRRLNEWDTSKLIKKKEGKSLTPDFIELHFKKNDREETIFVPMFPNFKEGTTLI